jgi:hypothetical protein
VRLRSGKRVQQRIFFSKFDLLKNPVLSLSILSTHVFWGRLNYREPQVAAG